MPFQWSCQTAVVESHFLPNFNDQTMHPNRTRCDLSFYNKYNDIVF